MALPIPGYIQSADVEDVNIRFRWDDWNVEQAEEPVDKGYLTRLQSISLRANIAFTIAIAEWIVARFAQVADVELYRQYLESAWAAVVDLRYCREVWEDYPHETELTGPIRGPLGIAMIRIQYAIGTAVEGGNPELRAAWITNLAQYVLTNPEPYLNWHGEVLRGLESLYLRVAEDPLGEVVPREALDPSRHFEIEETEALINRFLGDLDYRSNPFLNTPERMPEEGFIGTPYRFEIETDRKLRHRP